MLVYRICLAKYADDLFAAGRRARWNTPDKFVIYTAATRALACLENVVHRSGEGLNGQFRVLVIDVPDDLAVAEITTGQLPAGWAQASRYAICQPLGDAWYEARPAVVLRVPSSIVSQEANYIHPPPRFQAHPAAHPGRIRLRRPHQGPGAGVSDTPAAAGATAGWRDKPSWKAEFSGPNNPAGPAGHTKISAAAFCESTKMAFSATHRLFSLLLASIGPLAPSPRNAS
ncbi:hypothetical protein GCM10022408_19960 [Hymenobacter fastidiosus]|uniref:RES domain-containing protein n=1 Tax=Hymenobacter fastidiosus TaxID=486264 RepID=A0ABP7S8H7_9BACT